MPKYEPNKIELNKEFYPDLNNTKTTSLMIGPGNTTTTKTNYGLLFIRELKLWSLYNLQNYNTNCFIRHPQGYPFLLNYFSFDTQSFNDEIKKNLIGKQVRRADFKGFNQIDLSQASNMQFFTWSKCKIMLNYLKNRRPCYNITK
jgi:hypothetical protein